MDQAFKEEKMRRKLIKLLIISLVLSLIWGLMEGFALAAKKELTPLEWLLMKWEDRLKYKTVKIRTYWMGSVQDWMEEKNLPTDVTTVREKIHTGDTETPFSWYNVALFEIAHPKVYVEPVSFQPWTRQAPQVLAAAIAAGNAPSVYQLADPSGALTTGLAADITDLVTEEWQNLHLKKEYFDLWKVSCWYEGRCYGLPRPSVDLPGVTYRTDWFKEAGIFNKKGEPGPPEDWTWKDFREICKKLTDPKKNRFGIGYTFAWNAIYANYDLITLYANTHGWPMTCNDRITPAWIMPDKTGKQVYRAGVIKPIVDAMKFFNEMRWVDNSLLIEQGAVSSTQFQVGRTGMFYLGMLNDLSINPEKRPYLYSSTETAEDLIRAVMAPTASYGIQPNGMFANPNMFDASLDKEHLKAAFDWVCWNFYGRGYQNQLLWQAQLREAGDTRALVSDSVALIQNCYKIEIPPMVKKLLDEIDAKHPATRKNFRDLIKKGRSLPILPYSTSYGLKVENAHEIINAEASLRYAVLIEKNASRDRIEKMMEETGAMINKKMLNYKIKDSLEKWREYFKVLDNFYKKNYPEFYGGKDYEENFVSYFKF